MDIKEKLKELGLKIEYTYDIEVHGFYLPESNTIYINDYLMGEERENAILHELGHFINKHQSTSFSAPAVHIKHEAEADKYWITERVKEFLSLYDYPPEEVDINRFLTIYSIKSCYYDVAEELFKEYLAI